MHNLDPISRTSQTIWSHETNNKVKQENNSNPYIGKYKLGGFDL